MLFPQDVQRILARRFQNRYRDWFDGAGRWPMSIALGVPTEDEVTQNPAAARQWAEAWSQSSALPGQIMWDSRQWRRLGAQRLPVRLTLFSVQDAAEWAGEIVRWQRAFHRRAALTKRWPAFVQPGTLSRHFDVLADYTDLEFERLVHLLSWIIEHPNSGLYPRQLPIEGLDTKWLEGRRGVVADLVRALRTSLEETQSGRMGSEHRDFYDLCGLLSPPARVRIRILCPDLRKHTGNLCDLEAPVEELARLMFEPRMVFVVENLETGLALPDMPGTVAILKLGNAVSLLGTVAWAVKSQCVYWGDIDTHGFAILDRARALLPDLRSVLMGEETLLAYRSLCTEEPSQHGAGDLARLTESERQVYRGLKAQIWGTNLRLEQERIPWQHALEVVTEALAGDVVSARYNNGI